MKLVLIFHLFLSILFYFHLLPTIARPLISSNYPPFQSMSHISVSPAPAPESDGLNKKNSSSIFNVLTFGAIGDGVTDDTQAIKMAWDIVCQTKSSTILIPHGHSFMIQSTIFTGPCKSNIVFQIEGTLMAPDGPKAWPKNNSKRQWLVFYRINGMVMQGGGIIDGKGEKWWNLPCKPHKGIHGSTLPGPCDSPVALRFYLSTNLTVRSIRIKNSPQFHFRFDSCKDVHVNLLNINSPFSSPNTDGIHIENTSNVKIYNSVVSNGDDCVSIGAGCFNVEIRNITCGPGHGISIGSLGPRNSKACVSNITVRDSMIKHSDNGVRIKTWQGGYGSVSKIIFKNIHMDTVRNPILIDQYYCLTKGCINQTSAVYVTDISYINIKGTYDVRSRPMRLACSDTVPCTKLTFADVSLFPSQGEVFTDPFCWKAYGEITALTIPPVSCLSEGFPLSIPQNNVNTCLSNV